MYIAIYWSLFHGEAKQWRDPLQNRGDCTPEKIEKYGQIEDKKVQTIISIISTS